MASSSSKVLACLALAIIVAMTMVPSSVVAQNLPQDYVNQHNSARVAVGVGPVSCNNTLEAYATSYAVKRKADCALKHSLGPYGENIFWGSAGKAWSATDAVPSWVDEKQWYHYDTNSCSPPQGRSCGHYTQVVWRSSTNIGCARVDCDNSGGVFIVCSYNPPVNFEGQKPYLQLGWENAARGIFTVV